MMNKRQTLFSLLICLFWAAAAIAQTGVSTGKQAIALAVFVVVGTLGPGLPVAIYFAMGERATHILEGLKAWMGAHNAAPMSHPTDVEPGGHARVSYTLRSVAQPRPPAFPLEHAKAIFAPAENPA